MQVINSPAVREVEMALDNSLDRIEDQLNSVEQSTEENFDEITRVNEKVEENYEEVQRRITNLWDRVDEQDKIIQKLIILLGLTCGVDVLLILVLLFT